MKSLEEILQYNEKFVEEKNTKSTKQVNFQTKRW